MTERRFDQLKGRPIELAARHRGSYSSFWAIGKELSSNLYFTLLFLSSPDITWTPPSSVFCDQSKKLFLYFSKENVIKW